MLLCVSKEAPTAANGGDSGADGKGCKLAACLIYEKIRACGFSEHAMAADVLARNAAKIACK